jgi:UDP-N-acetylmuramoyl-tripeptide--D-alanyl-D-alanine ligase
MVEPGVAPRIEADLCLLGAQSALNAAAAVACAAALRARPFAASELRSIQRALETIRPVPGRLSIAKAGKILIIDDSYNSNPRSARAALEAASEVARGAGARLIVAMGDMLELGPLSAQAHAELVAEVARRDPFAFVAVGKELAAACRAAGAARATLAADSGEAARLVRAIAGPGDVLLVKGSRGLRMEQIIEELVAAR